MGIPPFLLKKWEQLEVISKYFNTDNREDHVQYVREFASTIWSFLFMHEQDSIFCIFNNINMVKMSWSAQHFRKRVDHPLGKGARLQLACWRAPALPLVSLCSKSQTPTSCCSWPSTLTFYRGGKCKETFLIEINKATHYCILMWLKPCVFGVSWCVLKMHTTKLHVPRFKLNIWTLHALPMRCTWCRE